ncbi:MAG TPA: threonine-phosphate decarboxylase CobD [Candidatus Binatia bacterium]|nr:threonine-phosphate decarboxylase CobD [Candidatus Binatia bacterium]
MSKRNMEFSGKAEGTNTMKPVDSLVRDNVKNLKPCVHGAEVLSAAEQSGFKPQDILDFSSSVNPLGPSKKALQAARGAFNQIAAYPDSNSNELRQIIASHFGIIKENVVVGNGSTELMYLFAEVFLKKGEKAIMPIPTFGEYESAVCKTGETPKFAKLGKNFTINSTAFKRDMAGAKIVFLCNPNNPTSMLIPQETLTDIVETALDQNTLVFLDEDFLEFVENEKALTMIGKIKDYPNLFILRSFTKIFGLTGLRVGYGIANQEIIRVVACAKIPWNVNCLAQVAAVAALKDQEHLNVTRELIKNEKAWLQSELGKFGSFKFSTPDANFFFIDIRKSGLTATELTDRLLKQGMLIRDCTSFRCLDEFYVRIAVKTHLENERLIGALKRAVKAV